MEHTTPIRGMNLDQIFGEVQDGEYGYTLNATIKGTSGEILNIQNEEGNELCSPVVALGQIKLPNNEKVIFSNKDGNIEIGILCNCEYKIITTVTCNDCFDWKFDSCNPITGDYRIRNGCERVIYFGNGIIPDMIVNLDNVENQVSCEDILWSNTYIDFCFEVEKTSGSLPKGKYQFAIQYLDEDENVISTSSLSTQYDLFDTGGFEINIDIPESVSFIKYYLISYTTGSLTPAIYESGITRTTPIVINNLDSDQLIDSTIEQILVKPTNYISSEIREFVDNRVVKTGLKTRNYNYAANQIFRNAKVNWKLVDGDISTFTPNEIYSIGVVPIHKDGTEMPVIPLNNEPCNIQSSCEQLNQLVITNSNGREYRVLYRLDGVIQEYIDDGHIGDKTIIETCGEITTVSIAYTGFTPVSYYINHIPTNATNTQGIFDTVYKDGEQYEAWELYNTATFITETYGNTGYYHCREVIEKPIKSDCIDNFFPTSCCNNQIEGAFQSYFMMPNIEVPKGKSLQFEIVPCWENLPDEVIGYKFVYSSANRVWDSGVAKQLSENQDGNFFTYFETSNTNGGVSNVYSLHTPKTHHGNTPPDCIMINGKVQRTNKCIGEEEYNDGISDGNGRNDIYIGYRGLQYTDFTPTAQEQYEIEEYTNLLPAQYDLANTSQSLSLSTSIPIAAVDGLVPIVNEQMYAFSFINKNACPPKSYEILHECVLNDNQSFITNSGDAYNTSHKVQNTVLVKVANGWIGNVLNIFGSILLASLGVAVTALSGGTLAPVVISGISAIITAIATNVPQILNDINNGVYDAILEDDDFKASGEGGTGYTYYGNEILEYCTVSPYSTKEDVETNVLCPNYKGDVCDVTSALIYFTNAIIEEQDGEYVPKPQPCAYLTTYNQDLIHIPNLQTFIELPQTYNYCSECSNDFTNTIIYSQPSFSESSLDGYRTFLTNDYTIVGEHTGAITALHYDKNRLLVRTEESLFIMSPNPQVINTDTSIAYLGSGDFLSIPPAEFVKTEYGSFGGTGILNGTNTEYGYFYVDTRIGKVYLITESPQDIGGKLTQWFKDNLTLNEQYKTTECNDILCDCMIITYWDNRLSRYILTKNCGDCNSFTVSYDPMLKSWVSFHSYIPQYAFFDEHTFYTVNNDGTWKHGNGEYQTYYNVKYDWILETITRNLMTSDIDVVSYYAKTLEYDDVRRRWRELIFPSIDRIWIYTDRQSTGIQEVQNTDDVTNIWNCNWNQPNLVHADHNYRIAQIRDYSNGDITTTIDCNYIPQPDNVEKKTQWDVIPIRDKYYNVRFYFKPSENLKFIFDLATYNKRPSIL